MPVRACSSTSFLLAALAAACLAAPMPALAQDSTMFSEAAHLSRADFAERVEDPAGRRLLTATTLSAELRRLYAARDWALLWSRDGEPTRPARAVIDALGKFDERGLLPADFDVAQLTQLVRGGLKDADDRASFDEVLSTASLRALHALRNGRTPAADASARRPAGQSDDANIAELLTLASSPAPAVVFDAAEPQYAQYRHLKLALARYRAIAAVDSSAGKRVAQLSLSLERWRWLPHRTNGPMIIVNVPAFKLHVLDGRDGGESELLSMDVVVGESSAHRTPIFSDTIEYLVFAPNWNVPMSLVRSELLPIARRDPYLLTVNNYQIVNARGRVIPATAASVQAVSSGKAWIRQLPGGTNALGKVKFMFPNAHDIYLHDTPTTPDFALTRRDRSHGCIRVADPAALAKLLLRGDPAWNDASIARAMRGRDPVRVNLARGVPVHIVYATSTAREDGTVEFHDDIYGLDAALEALLSGDLATAPR